MGTIDTILALADAYRAAEGISESTLSARVFYDGKKLAALRAGAEIGSRRAERTIEWFARNWPGAAAWPTGIPVPVIPTIRTAG